jgi:hypothetical protein
MTDTRRSRNSLLVVLTCVLVIASSWLAYYVPKYAAEQSVNRATALVTKYRAVVREKRVKGDQAPLVAYDIDFTGSTLTDRELADLAGYPNLIGLDVAIDTVSYSERE